MRTLWLATVSMLFCCMPAGFVAVGLALEARRREASGDAEAAARFTRLANLAALATVGLGLFQWLVLFTSRVAEWTL